MFIVIFFVRVRPTPRSTRTSTRVPYTTHFRSLVREPGGHDRGARRHRPGRRPGGAGRRRRDRAGAVQLGALRRRRVPRSHRLCPGPADRGRGERSEEHTSELQSLMRISYAVFCLKKKIITKSSTVEATL